MSASGPILKPQTPWSNKEKRLHPALSAFECQLDSNSLSVGVAPYISVVESFVSGRPACSGCCESEEMNDKEENKHPPALGSNASDRLAALLRSTTGLVPGAGAALAEIITALIPNQRIERIEKYLLYLHEELARLRPTTWKSA